MITKFPILKTTRLLLREIDIEDAGFIHYMRSDSTVNQFVDRKATKDVIDAEKFIFERKLEHISGQGLYWSIDNIKETRIMGSICLWKIDLTSKQGEIGYDLHPSWQGQGFMIEAVRKVADFGMLGLDLKRIVGITTLQNKPSQNVLEKAGFVKSDDVLSESDKQKKLLGYVLERTES